MPRVISPLSGNNWRSRTASAVEAHVAPAADGYKRSLGGMCSLQTDCLVVVGTRLQRMAVGIGDVEQRLADVFGLVRSRCVFCNDFALELTTP